MTPAAILAEIATLTAMIDRRDGQRGRNGPRKFWRVGR